MTAVAQSLKPFALAFPLAVQQQAPVGILGEAMTYATARGKRIRPFFVLEWAKILGIDSQQAMVAAIAVEMIHAYSLVHDDLPAMDDDDLRRGQPTVHIQFDEATAILAGDALQAAAFAHIAHATSVPAELRVRWLSRLADAAGARGMVLGQMQDWAAEGKTDLALTEMIGIQSLKTGAIFSFCMLAVTDAHAQAVVLSPLMQRFATSIGCLFQLSDDIIGATVNAGISGKTTGSDARHRKATLVQALGLDAARAEAQRLAVEAESVIDEILALCPSDADTNCLINLVRWLPDRNY